MGVTEANKIPKGNAIYNLKEWGVVVFKRILALVGRHYQLVSNCIQAWKEWGGKEENIAYH